MGLFQKRRYKSFVEWINAYDEADASTHQGCNCTQMTANEVFLFWKLEPETILFTGHAVALQIDDDYLTRPALEMINRVKLYAYSVARYGNSPYIYPKWGLGGLPEGFSRRCAVHGGVYMLNVEEKANFVEKVLFDANGRVSGVMSEGKSARCKQLIADPSYFKGTDKIRVQGQVARCICILDHPIPSTDNADSCQIIIPGSAVGRKSDIYILLVSSLHNVASKGKYIAVASTNVEGKEPDKEIAPALAVIGPVLEKFFWVTDYYVPVNDPAKDGCFITTSYDATSHFESCTDEVIRYYERLTGAKLDLSAASAASEGEEQQ